MTTPTVSLLAPYPERDVSHHSGASGVASYTANLARALRDGGGRVHVVAPAAPEGPRLDRDGDDIVIDRCLRAGTTGLHHARESVLQSGAPVCHVQFELFLYGGPSRIPGVVRTVRSLRRNGVPTVVTLHQAVEPGTVDGAYTAMHRVRVPAAVARIGIAATQRALEAAATATIVHEEPFRTIIPTATVIPHGVERLDPVDRAAARARLGLDERLVVLCFGFVSPYKGLEVALEAADIAGGAVQCVVAGGTHPRLEAVGDDYAGALERRFPQARFTGWVPGADVEAWFGAADVAVFPYPQPFSSSGALSLALASGTPVLLSAPLARCVGAPSALVAHGVEDLAATFRRLASDPGERDALARWTAILRDDRSWAAVAARHRELYSGVTS